LMITVPAGPATLSSERNAVVRDDTAGRFAPLNVTRFDMTVSLLEFR
jgi:hypothetical protein